MKLFTFLFVLLSAFCAAFARYSDVGGQNLGGAQLVRSSRAVSGRALKTTEVAPTATALPLDGSDDDSAGDDSDDDMNDDSDDDFDGFSDFDGESDDDCPTGQYTFQYATGMRFSQGRSVGKGRCGSVRSCAKICSKRPACRTFNFNRRTKVCQMFKNADKGRGKKSDGAAYAGYLSCDD